MKTEIHLDERDLKNAVAFWVSQGYPAMTEREQPAPPVSLHFTKAPGGDPRERDEYRAIYRPDGAAAPATLTPETARALLRSALFALNSHPLFTIDDPHGGYRTSYDLAAAITQALKETT